MSIIRSLSPIALASLLCFSATASADVIIKFPSNIDILAVNSEEPDISGNFFASEKSVTLPDGVNQIVFRYKPSFQEGNEQISITTDAIITKFDAKDTTLYIDVPEYRNADQARDFDKNPTWKLIDDSGNAIPVDQDKLMKNGVQLGRKYDSESVAYNKKGGVAAITASAAIPAAAAVQPVKMSGDAQYKNTEEQMLHYWFDKADAETQQRFVESIKKAQAASAK